MVVETVESIMTTVVTCATPVYRLTELEKVMDKQNIWMRSMFLLVRLLDGFETTRDNARGYLPRIMRESGFSKVDKLAVMATPMGTIEILQATI